MAKSKKEIKKLYKHLRKNHTDLSDEFSNLIEEKNSDDIEWRYLSEFIHYKNLDEEFKYFRENAHEEVDENLPFSRLKL